MINFLAKALLVTKVGKLMANIADHFILDIFERTFETILVILGQLELAKTHLFYLFLHRVLQCSINVDMSTGTVSDDGPTVTDILSTDSTYRVEIAFGGAAVTFPTDITPINNRISLMRMVSANLFLEGTNYWFM